MSFKEFKLLLWDDCNLENHLYTRDPPFRNLAKTYYNKKPTLLFQRWFLPQTFLRYGSTAKLNFYIWVLNQKFLGSWVGF